MDKKDIIQKYKNDEERLLVSKIFDKIELADKTNKIQTTDFLNEVEQHIVQNVFNLAHIENYEFYGGYDNSTRKIVIIYPEKMKEIFSSKCFKYDAILSAFRIIIPKNDRVAFNHSVYLGGIIKLGIKREKIGDILVYDEGADIIVKDETKKFLYANLGELARFKQADIRSINLCDIVNVEQKFEIIKVIVSSFRLDNIVSELAKTSRNKALEILEQERVFINYAMEKKSTKQIKEKDVITIRGKGKFIVDQIIGNTRKSNYVVTIKKYA